MPFPVLGSNSAVAGYEIDNSLRFNDDDNPYLSITPSSTGSRTKATVSFWVKRSELGDECYILHARSAAGYESKIRFSNSDELLIDNTVNGSAANGFYFQSSRLYRDPSAWYHIFFSVDTTQANATDGWRLYINGVQQTKALDFWVQNANFEWSQSGVEMNIGRNNQNTTDNFDGYLAEYYYIDGTIKAYTDFGEFNDNGVWIPKTYDGGSYGTNGFFLEFQDSGNLGDDTSGNTNDFTATNLTATDQTTDTPTNNFIVWNALNHNGNSLQEGNTFTETRNSTDRDAGAMGNIGLTRGKWYWELKITAVGDHTYAGIINIGNRFDMADEDYDTSSGGADGYPIYDYVEDGRRGTNTGSGRSETGVVQATYGNGDILNFALDLDNNKIHYGKNGTYGESSDPANNTNGIAISDGVYYTPVVVGYGSGDVHANFGQPAFSISSGNTDANGYGNFEYAVPSGYYSICTKNLAEYG